MKYDDKKRLEDTTGARRLLAVILGFWLIVTTLFVFVKDADAQGVIVNGEGTATLSWTAPTENEDGSTLTDLTGYVIYWGPQSRVDIGCVERPATRLDAACYPNALDLNDPTQTSEVITLNLSGDTTIYFTAVAYNSQNQLSRYSNEATKVFTVAIDAPPNPPTSLDVQATFTCTTNQPNITCTITMQ